VPDYTVDNGVLRPVRLLCDQRMRGGVVAQAMSLMRAEQTGVWFETASVGVRLPVQSQVRINVQR